MSPNPDLLVDLHWTLASCRRGAGSAEESLKMLDRALAVPGVSVRHRARLLVRSRGRMHSLGELAQAGQVATGALAAASQAGDTWAMGWALHVLSLVTGSQGRTADALSLFDQALAVTGADPALADLRLLLQLNKSVALAELDRCAGGGGHSRAGAGSRRSDRYGNPAGPGALRSRPAALRNGALGRRADRGDDDQPSLKEPAAACYDLGLAAIIRFHRGETGAARRHLAAAAPYAAQICRARLVRLPGARPQHGS